ncbi:glucan ABC transporter ATP-binding protein/ permease [Polynucleobacter arcticus]|uniref:Glucan ABC transporter ATP-binding protein/ permease n=1 Tax=Polynucleobacter arcticus TaxID=1743165 RepID=A0A6M9PW61_9BURK|nr:glucan ABC transporter ATP-binding protein/ permease [Polynucleobacter arcticus]QKM60203.1 glucan ABC transporter ATP-binding protein/ permease [Polynucleobacter arcticus]
MSLIRIYTRALKMLDSDRNLAWILAFANLALAVTLFAEPILFGKVINTLASTEASKASSLWNDVAPLLIVWVLFGFFTIGTSTLVALFSDRLAHRQRHKVFGEYFEHVLHMPLKQQSQTHSGRLMKIMLAGTDTLWWLWLSFFREHLSAFISLIILIPLALYMNWQLALVLISLCLFFGLLTHFILRKTQDLQHAIESHHSDLAELASDTLSNIALVQSFSRIQVEVKALHGISQKVLRAQLPVLSWWAIVTVLTKSATTLSILCIVVLGSWLYAQSLITIGEIVTFIAFAGIFIGRLEQIVTFANKLATDAPRLQEFFGILDTSPDIQNIPNAIDPGRCVGLIQFDQVCFTYNNRHKAIDRLSFTANPGETIALVGASGAGKSTALSLLYRAFDTQSGQITIDGIDIKNFDLSALRRNIGVVFQEPLLFNRSIVENLLVGAPDASEMEIRIACLRAQALDFIERQPEGFDTIIGERGRILSGGERQRLSIARALLKDPPILVLDEATSALDGATEENLIKAMSEVMRTRTTLVIAHRLSTIKNADMILVMEAGRIIETGTYQSLCEKSSQFNKMVNIQLGLKNP